MKVFFASDHAGFELKKILMEHAAGDLGHEVVDCGAFEYDETDDYPDFIAVAIANLRPELPNARAIILGKSGQGEAMLANRFAGIRATVYYGGPEEIITLSREHNDANVLSLGAGFVDPDSAKDVIRLWLDMPFSNEERHQRRIDKLDADFAQ